ncbi:hypothetical protein Pelo_8219 [Pelomyxa schiedti]|nr:hypothetical protein Pelo_8219 [Pelomyxa schiedti]
MVFFYSHFIRKTGYRWSLAMFIVCLLEFVVWATPDVCVNRYPRMEEVLVAHTQLFHQIQKTAFQNPLVVSYQQEIQSQRQQLQDQYHQQNLQKQQENFVQSLLNATLRGSIASSYSSSAGGNSSISFGCGQLDFFFPCTDMNGKKHKESTHYTSYHDQEFQQTSGGEAGASPASAASLSLVSAGICFLTWLIANADVNDLASLCGKNKLDGNECHAMVRSNSPPTTPGERTPLASPPLTPTLHSPSHSSIHIPLSPKSASSSPSMLPHKRAPSPSTHISTSKLFKHNSPKVAFSYINPGSQYQNSQAMEASAPVYPFGRMQTTLPTELVPQFNDYLASKDLIALPPALAPIPNSASSPSTFSNLVTSGCNILNTCLLTPPTVPQLCSFNTSASATEPNHYVSPATVSPVSPMCVPVFTPPTPFYPVYQPQQEVKPPAEPFVFGSPAPPKSPIPPPMLLPINYTQVQQQRQLPQGQQQIACTSSLFQECFDFGGPHSTQALWDLSASSLGVFH